MSAHILLHWIAKKLDAAILDKTQTAPDQQRLTIEIDEENTRITTVAGGFKHSPGALKLVGLGSLIILIVAILLIAVAINHALNPRPMETGVMVILGCFSTIFVVAGLFIIRKAIGISRESVRIDCHADTLHFHRITPREKKIDIPVDSITSVTVTDLFAVCLELLVVTKDHRVHRLLAGLGKSELMDAAAIIESYRKS